MADGEAVAPTLEAEGGAAPAVKRSDADIYVIMAEQVIAFEFGPGSSCTRWDVRTWWRDEGPRRKAYRLSKGQEDALLDLCRAACEPLPEGTKNPDEWPEKAPSKKPGTFKRSGLKSAV